MSCNVCWNELTVGQVKLDCSHTYCISCFVAWTARANTCPTCRAAYTDKPIAEPKQSRDIDEIWASLRTSCHAPGYFSQLAANLEGQTQEVQAKILERATKDNVRAALGLS